MRVLFVDAPPELLEERRRLGLDVRDELWEGVVHVVPQPASKHQIFGGRLLATLLPLADRHGLVLTYEMSVHRPGDEKWDYRIPDLVAARPEHVGDGGVEGPPELVVEILSPHDESRQKRAFYAEVGCQELLLIDRLGHAFELCRLADGELARVVPDEAGAVRVATLDVVLPVPGAALRIVWDGGEAEIPFE